MPNHDEPRRIWADSRRYRAIFRRKWDAKRTGKGRYWRLGATWGRRVDDQPPPAPFLPPANPQAAIFMPPRGPTAGDALRMWVHCRSRHRACRWEGDMLAWRHGLAVKGWVVGLEKGASDGHTTIFTGGESGHRLVGHHHFTLVLLLLI